MQGNRDNADGRYLPQATTVFSNFNLQQPIRYPQPQFYSPNSPDLSSFSLGNANLHNLNFHRPQIPHQFGANANVFLQFPPQPCLPSNGSHNRGPTGAFERRVHGTDVVDKDIPKSSSEVANSFSVSLPIPPSSELSERDELHTPWAWAWAAQAQETGRKGEEIAYRYYVEAYGKESVVRWVNEQSETCLPYDLLIERGDGKKEYVEVKATVSTRKDYFNLTVREWQYAYEKGDCYIIAHVLLGNSNAILTQHTNPFKLCQQGRLRLV